MSTPKDRAIAAGVIVVFSVVFLLLLFFFNVFQASMASVPFDAGWIGLLFIFANGFLLSVILDRSKIGVIERLMLSLGLGFGVSFAVFIALAVLWTFSFLSVLIAEVTLLIALSVAAVLRGFRIPSTFSQPRINVNIPRHLAQTILLVLIGFLGFFALYKTITLPATEWDSLAYGVTYAKIIFQNGNVPLIAGPSIGIEMSAAYPPGVQLTAASLYALAGTVNDFYYRLLSPIFSLATLLVTYKFAMLLTKNRTYSIFAVSALCAIPYFWELFIQETYLLALTFMLTASAFFFFKAYSVGSCGAKKYEVIGTLFCGFSALTSYIGLFSLGILLLYALHKKVSAKHTLLLTGLMLIVAAPWYLRNLVLLGNPIYPFLGVGKYLDPVLLGSTAHHFQQYNLLFDYGLISVLSKVGVGILVAAIAYLTFSKRRDFFMTLPYYLLLMCLIIMGFHVAFPRYLILALPALAVTLFYLIKTFCKSPKLSKAVLATFLALFILSSTLMLPYVDTVKPSPKAGENQSLYLSRIYEEGDAWVWINQNTPANARIATFDIKTYYIERAVMPLDGNESAPLYQLDSIEESMAFLEEHGVTYVLSVPWASPTDNRLPHAYTICPITPYLGDPRYLPPVFVGVNGTAIYHVGALDDETVYRAFAQRGMQPPTKNVTVNLTITNTTAPVAEFYLPIPVDYRSGSMLASINSSRPVDVELWIGLATTCTGPSQSGYTEMVDEWRIQGGSGSVSNSSFVWQVDKAGYFVFRVVDAQGDCVGAFNVTVNLRFSDRLQDESTNAGIW